MIIIKNKQEITVMRDACRISNEALQLAGTLVKPGVSTLEIDNKIGKYIKSKNATASFLGYGNFPKNSCISVNSTVIHGIPSEKIILKDGDIVSVDIGAYYKGFHGDNAWTFPCGKITETAQRLLDTTKNSLFEGIKNARAGYRIGDISSAIQQYVETRGYSVVRDFVGHGVGKKLHEDPSIPNFGTKGRGLRLQSGMTIAIEPMVNAGVKDVIVLDDGWTTVTKDGKLSAHFEHTVAITDNGPEILTLSN